MHTNRLVALARRLRVIAAAPPKDRHGIRGFSLSSWRFISAKGETCDYQGNPCGATACAFGEAALMPEFKKLGLKWSRRNKLFPYPVFKDEDGMRAAAKFFDIPEEEAEQLFDPGRYSRASGPLDVVKHIEELVTRPQ